MLPRSKVQAIGLLLAAAVVGFASGAATISWAGDSGRRHGPPRSYSEMLQNELRLSDAQRDSVRTLLRNHRPRMRAVMDVVRPQMDSLRDELRTEIRAVLTPAQQAAYDTMLSRERAMRARADSASTSLPNRHDD
jgi:hypothetical protein